MSTAELACEVCGRLPAPRRARLTVAHVAAMLPVELAVHALVIGSHLSFFTKVLVLSLAATALAVWVAEPSVMRVLRRWLHAPVLRERRRYDAAAGNLWRIRTTVEDTPGALGAITHQLSHLEANILGMHLHPAGEGVIDEFVVATPEHITARDLAEAVEDAGGTDPQVWPTTALALVDGQTKALTLAVRVATDPTELAPAVAELLDAEHVVAAPGTPLPTSHLAPGATMLKVPATWHGAHVFARPGQPFTPAESARAHRLAELAEVVERRGTRHRPPPMQAPA
ncbi:amino acid-binding protein [Georgenia sp. TF02-10]|uniref:amino acid-binding protein n=1 Tax=Georgenia sp. TF02-10 TaxID=2917725 RepID=UPI001FA77E90|nr:amino acid-binding protein [Georgenia sp. TF02-10]UNX54862.1 amino acid-binding protein [Georgenia sp. TF02-10]